MFNVLYLVIGNFNVVMNVFCISLGEELKACEIMLTNLFLMNKFF